MHIDKRISSFDLSTTIERLPHLRMKPNNWLPLLACLALAFSGAQAKEKKVPLDTPVENFTFKDIHYLPRTLDDLGEAKAYVIMFTTTQCPLVQRYLPRLKELSSQYGEKRVRFLALNVGPDDSIKEIAYQALEHDADFPFAKDFDGQCARAVG